MLVSAIALENHRRRRLYERVLPVGEKGTAILVYQRPDLGRSQIIAMPPHREHAWNEIDWFEDRPSMVTCRPGWAAPGRRGDAEGVGAGHGGLRTGSRSDALLAAGKEAMQKHLWRRDHYMVYNDPVTGKALDAFFSPTLNGQYYARAADSAVFPKQNVDKVLAVMRDKVCKLSKLGMPPLYRPRTAHLEQG